MRYVSSAAVMAFVLSTFAPWTAFGALNVSITNYQTVSDQRASLTQWYVTFKADLANNGPALPGVTATLTSRSSSVQIVAGQGTLHFTNVPANGRVTSADTFTLLVDRSVAFDWSQVEWSFMNPVANPGPNQTAPVTGAVRLDGSGCSNPSGAGTLAYSWAFQSVPTGSKAQLTGANTPTPSFVVDAAGTYKLKLTVSNGTGTDSAIVTVSTVNSPPVAAAGPDQTVAAGATVALNGSKSSDVDGDTLTYSWSFISKPAQSSAVLFGAQTVSPTFAADARGTYKVQLIVNDGKVDSQPSIVTITTANTPPVANAGANQTVAQGMFVQLNGAGSTDVDGDSLTYRWSFNLMPPGSTAKLSSPTAVNPSFTADQTGTYIVQLIVNDGKIDSAASTVTITTNAVQAPTAIAGADITVHAGATVQLHGSGTDPQNFSLTYKWSLPTLPGGSMATLSATNVSNPSFVADLPGTYGAQLVVNNGTLSSLPSTVTITTTDTPPVADPGPTQSVYIGDTVYLDGSRSSDADGDPIKTYSWTFSSKPDGSNAVLSGANTKMPTFIADMPGAYVVQLIVADAFASSQAKTVTINVGAKTMAVTPAPLALYNAPGSLTITLSPTPATSVPVTISAETAGIVSFTPNPVTIPANSSGANVTVTPTSPGTTKINLSATGYYSTTATVTVTKPSISIVLNGSTVGLTYKLSGSITLDANAPPGGTVVALSSVASPDGVVSFDSNSVTIPEGTKTGTFAITGVQLGTATINATAPGYNSGSQPVSVIMLGSVSLGAGVSVPAGQSAPLNVQLSAPAPSGGVTVTLASGDTTKLTVSPTSVLIKGGATAPDTPPQVSGAAAFAGEVSVTASAGGFFSDRQSIKVIGSVTFKDQVVSVGPGGVKSFSILLSAPAPTGGLLVYLSSSNESVATVPQGTALVPGGQQSVDAQFFGNAVGTADITLSTNPTLPGNQYFSAAGAVLHVTVASPALTITTDSLPPGTVGSNYPNTTLTATGGTGLSYIWSVVVGSLPTGLTLSGSGTISGSVASSATTSTFTVQVQDGGGHKETKTFTLTVNPGITIGTASLPTGVAGKTYPSTTLTVSGGTGTGYTWSLIGGSLPAGLSLSASGVISGTVSTLATTSTFTVQVHDSGTNTTSSQFTITINPALAITTGSLPSGVIGAAYAQTTLTATGGTGSGYVWSISSGLLPSGLTLTSAGVLSGTVSSSATTSTVTVQVLDSGSNAAKKDFTITITTGLAITTASLPGGSPGSTYPSTTLTASGGSGGYSWSISAGSLPSGLTLSSAGVLSGTLSDSATTSTFTIQVKDSDGTIASTQFTITIASALSVTTATLPVGTAGANYPSTTLAATGGSGNYTWSMSSGSALPSGLILSTSGVISGKLASSATTATFTVQVKDTANNNTATKQFTLKVNGALSITTASLPAGMAGAPYTSTTLAATGGSGTGYTWSVSAGSLPSGLTLSAGAVSGTLASDALTSTFTIQVKDSDGGTASTDFTIQVYPALSITTGSLPAGTAGSSYPNQLFAATGGSGGYSWSVSTGQLPSGLTLSGPGVLSGTLASDAATSIFTVQVQDSAGNKLTKQFTLTVNAALSITSGALPNANVGTAYPSTNLTAAGGTGTGYTWSVSIGALPDGLTLSGGGALSGTPTASATTSIFTVQVQDSVLHTATKQFTITVSTALNVTPTSLPPGIQGAAYTSTNLAATGGTGAGYTWSVITGQLPAGLTLSAGGQISGTVSASATTSTFTVQVQDSASNKASQQFTITVNPPVSISPASLPSGMVGVAYPATTLTATGGTGSGYTWSVLNGALPSGVILSTAGALSGTVANGATTSTVTVQVQDNGGNKATKQYTITVYPTLTITTPSLPDGAAAANYTSTTLAATGGTGAGYAWSVTNGSLPAGMTLSAGGVLSGALSNSATTSSFTVQVQDNAGNKVTKDFTIKVNSALTITTQSLPTGIAGSAYTSTTLAATGGTGAGYSWSVSGGTLPSGLTLTAAGVLSGTLSASASSANITIQVQDNGGNTATQAFTISVNSALSITTSALPDGVAGAIYPSTTLAATGGSGTSYTWSLANGTLPSGLTLTSAGVLSGTLSSTATASAFTIQVKDSLNNTATKQFTINVGSSLSVFTAVLPAGLAGANYGPVTLTASGGTGTGYAWSVSDGSLPAGLTLSSGGAISGTLSTSAVTSTFTIKVQDSGTNSATRVFTLTVNPVLSIAATTLPAGAIGSDYPATTLSASGGSQQGYTWSLASGSLPAGLTLGATTGVISGTVSAGATTSTFTVQVKDSANETATRQFSITINPAVQITTGSLPTGTPGVAYTSTTLTANGGTSTGYTWSISQGLLPTGLTLSPAGVLSGTPSNAATTSTFTVQVQDSVGNTGRKQFTLTVAVVITTTALPGGTAGVAYTGATLAAIGGAGAPYTWTVGNGSLPAGLSLSSTGAISGTLATNATTATFTVQAQDSAGGTGAKQLTIAVSAALTINTSSVPAGTAGAAYPNTTLSASGGTGTGYTWSVVPGSGFLPASLTLSSGGVISGTLLTSATSSTFTVQVKDSDSNTATRQLTITVNQPLTVSTNSLPTGVAGSAYSTTTLTASGGTGTGLTWSVTGGSLPSGLTLSPAGAISGTLTSAATTSTFTVQVQDSGNNIATKDLTITVNAALTVTSQSLPDGVAGSAYTSTTLTASGGTGTGYSWSLKSGTLPTNLTLSAAGAIAGTLTAGATTSSFTVQVQDSGGNIATKQLTITVAPALSITTSALPDGVAGAAYSSTLGATGGTGSSYTWSITVGGLPSGLILSSTGVISGSLSTSATTATFTVQVKDSGNNIATKQLSITVNPAVSITTQSLPSGVAGSAYTSTTLAAAGGTGTGYTWSLAGGSLPAGLSLSTAGVLSGTLSTSAVSSTFTVQAQDSGSNIGTKQFTIAVNPALGITTSAVPAGMIGAAYASTTLAASGGTMGGYTWSVSNGQLPAGLTLSTGGVLSGTPSAGATTSTFTVQVTDSGNNTATKVFTLTVYPTLGITTAALPGGVAGSAYTSTTLAASGGTGSGYAWSVSNGTLPAGLTLSSGGVLSGTLNIAAQSATFTVQVKDSASFTATKQFSITVTPAPLAITTNATLPQATVSTPYTATIVAVGGTLPYTWSASGLPSWLSLDTNGFVCGGVGNLCGTPAVTGNYSFSVTVMDNASPTRQSVTQTFSLTVNGGNSLGTITVPNATVGVNLQAPIFITLSPATSTTVVLTITSSNAGAVLLGNGSDGGKTPLNVTLSAGTTSVQVYLKALTTSSPVTITATADTGYSSGSGTVTITNSGFILSGPNGIGNNFTTYEGVQSGLLVYPYRLDSNNVPVESQPIRGGLSVNAPIAVAPSTLGSMSSPTVAFGGGDQSSSAVFTASFTNTGNASIMVSPPVGSSFSTPATGATLNVTIQQSGFIVPSGVTVGRNLQAAISIGLSGPAGNDTTVTIASSDPTTLRFSTGLTTAGAGTIQMLIKKGFSSTAQFYAQGYGSSGSVPYTISAPGYGSVTPSMPLGPSGFVIVTPGGQGTDFTVTLGGPDPSLAVSTALFDGSGQVVALQPVAADTSITATLTSFTPGVGTVSPTSVPITGGSSYGAATFHAVSIGSTTISASGSGYTGTSVKATVGGIVLFLNPVGSVGKNLAASGLVNLNTPAVADLLITLTSNDPSRLKLANNVTDAGSTTISVTVKTGSTNAAFWVFGLDSSGTASYSASVSGSSTVSDTVALAPSAVALYMGSPGNPSCFSTGGFGCTISLAGGAKTVYAVTYQLTTDGTTTINGAQQLAGSVPLTVPLKYSSPGVGSGPSSVSIAGGTSFTAFSFTPSATGTTVVSLNNLVGWTAPAYAFGFDLTQLGITVQP